MPMCDKSGRPIPANGLSKALDTYCENPDLEPLLYELSAYRGWTPGTELTVAEKSLVLWCVLTISKGFTAEERGCRAANELLKRLDEAWAPEKE